MRKRDKARQWKTKAARIRREADSWRSLSLSRPIQPKAVNDYTEDLRNRERTVLAQTLPVQTKRLLSSQGLPTLDDLVG